MQTFQEHTIRHHLILMIAVIAIICLDATPWKLVARELQNADKTVETRYLKIRVVNPDNQPIQGAQVFQNHTFFPKGSERAKLENHVRKTDARGIAILKIKGKNDDLRLWVSKEKYCPLHAMWARNFQSDGDQIPDEFTFQLVRGTRIGGIVKDEQGQPVSGVRVAVENLTAAIPVPDPPQPGRRPVPSPWLAENNDVVTDSNGRWVLENVPADNCLIFDPLLGEISPHTRKIAIKLSHQDYMVHKELEFLGREKGITIESLRTLKATIVMRKRTLSKTN